MNFKVHTLRESGDGDVDVSIDRHQDRTPALGREGDVPDEATRIVDEYMRDRGLDFYNAQNQHEIADYEYSTESDA